MWFFFFDKDCGFEMVVCVFGGCYNEICVGVFLGLNFFDIEIDECGCVWFLDWFVMFFVCNGIFMGE